ncbi:MAG: hypothetical protein WCK28_07240 [Burkholderiales bacterium]
MKALLWPATTLTLAWMFRVQAAGLLEKLTKLKVGDAEFAFQAPSTDAAVRNQALPAEPAVRGPGGFFTRAGIEDIVRSSGTIQATDTVVQAFPIFSTSRQQTWLAFTKQKVICLLDDETTRNSGRIIQWLLPREHATPIEARPHRSFTGLLDIGPRRDWLYSTSLFPTPESLVSEVRRALEPNRA